MLSESQPRATHGLDPHDHDLSTSEANVVLASARALQKAAQAGQSLPLLRGKNLALMSESADDVHARLFARAATELGAKVAHIRPSVSKLDTPRDARHTAGMLGRLYDAVACEGMPVADVRRLRDEASVPVYDNVASDGHPTAALADVLGGDCAPEDRRRYVLQAVLLSTLS